VSGGVCLVLCLARRCCIGNRKWLNSFVVGPVAGSARGYHQSGQGILSSCCVFPRCGVSSMQRYIFGVRGKVDVAQVASHVSGGVCSR